MNFQSKITGIQSGLRGGGSSASSSSSPSPRSSPRPRHQHASKRRKSCMCLRPYVPTTFCVLTWTVPGACTARHSLHRTGGRAQPPPPPRNAWMRMPWPAAATQRKTTARPNIIHKSTQQAAGHIGCHPSAQCLVVVSTLTLLLSNLLQFMPLFRSMIGMFTPKTRVERSPRPMARLPLILAGFIVASSSPEVL